jgi:hypothetical protein
MVAVIKPDGHDLGRGARRQQLYLRKYAACLQRPERSEKITIEFRNLIAAQNAQ